MNLQQAINQAMFLIGAVDSGNDATATESADMLRALNQMLAMWKQEDKDLQWPPQDTLTDTYPLPMWTEQPVIYNLATLGATLFNLPVPPDVAFIASEGQKFIAKTLINNNLTQKDMSHMPAGGGRWNIVTDSLI
jgi:hypothetical protein